MRNGLLFLEPAPFWAMTACNVTPSSVLGNIIQGSGDLKFLGPSVLRDVCFEQRRCTC